ncbi:arsenate reductase [Crenobacter caeni]|uniref:Arsenate reductase n=1 Tax=Crenobacter caeni TaxID=2705474 RepID=A0A6B2KR47_9NEIS|nr:arsenate reductase [Crenobacter caeni]NDV12604.1 arsenate reductase [Crenobacter caeni]
MLTVYGIPNCGTVKKARQWLADHEVDFAFHDFKKQGVPADALARWADAVGVETLVNRKGTTWRTLDADAQAACASREGALAQLAATPSLIKRPILDDGQTITVGFDEAAYRARLGK